jgi:transposase-like protein
MLSNDKNGISSYEIHRGIGVCQKTAWFMLHRIRLAMRTGTFEKLGGAVEADETFVGGRAKNMHAAEREQKIQGRGTVGKATVFGMIERGGDVIAMTVPDRKRPTLQDLLRKHVETGSSVYTDALASYAGLDYRYDHWVIDHAYEYVRGEVHTNSIENFWSLFKRCVKGTYVAVDPRHLDAYLDEEVFRFNYRRLNDAGRFLVTLSQTTGRRIQYKELTSRGK